MSNKSTPTSGVTARPGAGIVGLDQAPDPGTICRILGIVLSDVARTLDDGVLFSPAEVAALGTLMKNSGVDPVSEATARILFPDVSDEDWRSFADKASRLGFPLTRPHPDGSLESVD